MAELTLRALEHEHSPPARLKADQPRRIFDETPAADDPADAVDDGRRLLYPTSIGNLDGGHPATGGARIDAGVDSARADAGTGGAAGRDGDDITGSGGVVGTGGTVGTGGEAMNSDTSGTETGGAGGAMGTDTTTPSTDTDTTTTNSAGLASCHSQSRR
jgi:hypothetical protein